MMIEKKKFQNIIAGKEIGINDLYNSIEPYLKNIDGISFSGGEPLFQAESLLILLQMLPKELDKMLFTGYNQSEMDNTQKKCFSYFDLAVTGRFEEDKKGSFLWRGSKNQKFVSPTGKYIDELDELYNSKSNGISVKVKKGNFYFYGIPTDNNEIWVIKDKLNKEGVNFYD